MTRSESGPYGLETLAALPDPDLFETSRTAWQVRLGAWFEAETGRTLYPAQVETLLIDMLAYALTLIAEEAQATALRHLVAKAPDDALDLLGANRETPRLAAAAALTTLRFRLISARAAATSIPAGTRVRSGGTSFVFATIAEAAIPAGDLAVDVVAACEEPGAAANGIPAGGIATALDPIAGVSVSSITQSSGGADREGVDAYRLRIANAMSRLSRAGPRQGYRERVLAVSPAIIDVAVVRPEPCRIRLYALTSDGAAGPELRAAIATAIDTEEDRPLGDEVTVPPPVPSAWSATVEILSSIDPAAVETEARAAIDAVTLGWSRRLGGAIDPSALVAAVRPLVGVVSVSVSGFDYRRLAEHEFAVRSALDLTVGVA